MPRLLPTLFLLSLLSPICQAQMYKWVDAKGQTHYSDHKEEAGQAAVNEVKVAPAPDAPAPGAVPDWKTKEADFQRRLRERPADQPAPSRPRPYGAPYYSDKPDTDTRKCGLARDVVSGAARHMNGKSTDAYDREVAQNDIKSFCK